MNSCVLMAEIVSEPQLRSTQDNLDVAEMIVRFEGLREEDPPSNLKVLGWGNLASDIKNNYSQGDRIIIEGRLSMNTIERPEGYKEKRAELVASRIIALDASPNTGNSAMPMSSMPLDATAPAAIEQIPQEVTPVKPSPAPQTQESPALADTATSSDGGNWDEIPF